VSVKKLQLPALCTFLTHEAADEKTSFRVQSGPKKRATLLLSISSPITD